MTDIFIYDDMVHNHGTLHEALCDVAGQIRAGTRVEFTDARGIIGGALDKASLLVMPGGADLYFCEKLNGEGNARIRAFVEKGGAYLGICAGAYYGASEIFWAKDSPAPICGPRELSFYQGSATGPVYGWLEGGRIDGSWIAPADITYDDGETRIETAVFYEAGPVFSEPVDKSRVLARYTNLPDTPPAIIETSLGAGRVILTSPHIERVMPNAYNRLYEVNNQSYAHEKAAYEALEPHGQKQRALWGAVLRRLIRA